jgi:hypothetical protein
MNKWKMNGGKKVQAGREGTRRKEKISEGLSEEHHPTPGGFAGLMLSRASWGVLF